MVGGISMTYRMTRQRLKAKLDEQEYRLKQYSLLTGAGLLRKLKRLQLLGLPYLEYIAARLCGFTYDRSCSLFWGKKIVIPIHDVDTQFLRYFGMLSKEELPLTKYLIKTLQPDDVFYDIGANYGFFSILAKELIGREGEIHLFEPQEEVFGYLKKNITSPQVRFNQIALTDQEGEVSFFTGFGTGVSGKSSLSTEALARRNEKYRRVIVRGGTLDGYVQSRTSPTFIKLDVEGAEQAVLQGGYNTIKNNAITIAMEVWTDKEGSFISEKAVDLLVGAGYQAYWIDDEGDLHITKPLTQERKYENLIFTKHDSFAEQGKGLRGVKPEI